MQDGRDLAETENRILAVLRCCAETQAVNAISAGATEGLDRRIGHVGEAGENARKPHPKA